MALGSDKIPAPAQLAMMSSDVCTIPFFTITRGRTWSAAGSNSSPNMKVDEHG
jgi:hypothetical protein